MIYLYNYLTIKSTLMDEFKKPNQNNLLKDISEFNSGPAWIEIRNLYKQEFEAIKNMIQRFGHKHAIEDISNIDKELTGRISENRLLIQQINRAISIGMYTRDDIK